MDEHGDGNSWRQVCKLFDAAVPNKAGVKAKRLSAALHSFQAKNEVVQLKSKSLSSLLPLRTSTNTRAKLYLFNSAKNFI
jgi:hypothetical protein